MCILRCNVCACLRFYTPESQNDYVLMEWMDVRFYPMFPDFRNTIAFWKVPRLRSFVFQVRAASRWRWAQSIVGKNLGLRGERPAANCLIVSQGWRTLGTRHSLLHQLFLFLMPDHRLCTINNMCVYIYIYTVYTHTYLTA